MKRIFFKDVKKGDRFVSVIDKVEVGRRWTVTRKQREPKRVFLWTMGDFAIELDFTMAEINRLLRRATE